MLAATLAEGQTTIRPAAQEPEVDDLIAFLQKMGAAVERTYPDTIEIEGRKRLRGAEHRVIPDRIEAGTFVVAAAVTGGKVTLEGAPCDHLGAFIETVGKAGVSVSCSRDPIEVDGSGLNEGGFRAVDFETSAYPGGHRPPAAHLGAVDRGGWRLERPRGDLRGSPRVAIGARPDGRRRGRARRQPRRDPRRDTIARCGSRDRRPPGRGFVIGRARGRRRLHDSRCTSCPPGAGEHRAQVHGPRGED